MFPTRFSSILVSAVKFNFDVHWNVQYFLAFHFHLFKYAYYCRGFEVRPGDWRTGLWYATMVRTLFYADVFRMALWFTLVSCPLYTEGYLWRQLHTFTWCWMSRKPGAVTPGEVPHRQRNLASILWLLYKCCNVYLQGKYKFAPAVLENTFQCIHLAKGVISDFYIALFDVFLTVHHSIDLFHLPTLMRNSFIH